MMHEMSAKPGRRQVESSLGGRARLDYSAAMQGRAWVWGLAGFAAFACIMQSSDAGACAVAYPQGSFARFSAERSLIVWDAPHQTEHFVRALSLRGDPENFGVFVPTPSIPTIAKEDDAIINRIAELVAPPPPPPPHVAGAGGAPAATAAPPVVEVLQRTQLGDFEAVTLAANDENALGDWLGKHGFVDKPALRQWEKGYLDKKWLITAVRCTAKGAGDRTLEVPTMRLSFKIDAPFFPYTEVPPDTTDEASFRAKYNQGGSPYSPYSYGSRPFDLYFVATTPMQSMMGATTGGPAVADSVRVSGDALAGALGDTKSWGFDAHANKRWVVTHLSENVWQRVAPSDITFAAYDLPKPRPGAGTTASDVDDRPTGPTFPKMAPYADGPYADAASPATAHHKRLRIGAIFLFFLIAGAAAYAVLAEQQKRRA
jgi:hypothetical protein